MCKRINKGIYSLDTHQGVFDIEKFPCGSWMLFRVKGHRRDYLSDFPTKHAAVTYANSGNAAEAN